MILQRELFTGATSAFYLHVGSFAQFLIENLDRQIQAIDEEAASQPQSQPLKVALPA